MDQTPLPEQVTDSRPRVWLTLATFLGLFASIFVVSALVLGVVLAVQMVGGGDDGNAVGNASEAIAELVKTRLGLHVMILPPGIVLIVFAVIGAALTGGGIKKRLGLVRPKIAPGLFLLALLGTMGLCIWEMWFLSWLELEPSAQMEMMSTMFTSHEGWFAIYAMILAGLAPGLAEELFFRGYVQRRLLTRLSAPAGIGLASITFALMHFDPQHIMAVFPIGVWLGFVAWASRSTWTAIACHAANNIFAIGITLAVPALESGTDGFRVSWLPYLMGFTGVAFLIAVPALLRAASGQQLSQS